jgi:hypothetical protein
MANLFIYLHHNAYIQWITRLFNLILLAFVSFLVIIASISYGFIRTKQGHMQDASSVPCKNESIDVIEQEQHKVITVPQVSEMSTEDETIEILEFSLEVIITKANAYSSN